MTLYWQGWVTQFKGGKVSTGPLTQNPVRVAKNPVRIARPYKFRRDYRIKIQ